MGTNEHEDELVPLYLASDVDFYRANSSGSECVEKAVGSHAQRIEENCYDAGMDHESGHVEAQGGKY